MRTILITGSTDGIGMQTAFDLAKQGHEIIIHGRNESRGTDILNKLKFQTGNDKLHYLNADLTDFSAIHEMAGNIKTKFNKIDVLINNAGVYDNQRVILANGYEKTFMVNHLSHFSLTLQLLDLLKNAEAARIVNVSSMAQTGSIDFDNLNGEKYYDGYNAYALSKLENVLFTYKLARGLKNTGITVNALHPGVISTKLLHTGWGSGGAPVDTGSKTSVFVAMSGSLTGKTGLYFVNAKEQRSSSISYDKKIQDRLWEISLKYCGLEEPLI